MNQVRNSCGRMAQAAVLVAALIFCGTAEAVRAAGAFLSAEALLAGWDASYGDLTGMEASFQQCLITPVPVAAAGQSGSSGTDYRPEKYWHVEMVKDRNRYHTRVSCDESGFARAESLREYAFDGTIGKEYFARRRNGVVHRGLFGVPEENMESFPETYMLRWKSKRKSADGGLVDGLPHGRELLGAVRENRINSVVLPQLESVAGEECHVLELTGKLSGWTEKIWFAHNKGMLPLRHLWGVGARPFREIHIEEIGSVQTEKGTFWYPARGSWTEITPDAYKSGGKDAITYAFRMTKFVPDPKVDDSMFDLQFPLGTYVWDQLSGVHYKVGVSDKLALADTVIKVVPEPSIEDAAPARGTEPNAGRQKPLEPLSSGVSQAGKSGDAAALGVARARREILAAELILGAGIVVVVCALWHWRRQRREPRNVQNHT